MSRPNPLFVICFALVYFTTIIDSQSSNFTKKWSREFYQYQRAFVVKSNDSIIIVGTYDNFINMTTPDGVLINKCEYTFPPKKWFYQTNQVVALESGKILLYILLQNHTNGSTDNLIVIVDPHNCSSIKTLAMIDREIYISIIPYHDSFDLLLDNLTISRFNDLGEPIHLDYHRLDAVPDSRNKYLQTIKPFDASEGYIYRQDIFENSTLLKRLDSNFQTIKEVIVEPDMQEIATSYNRISLCHQKHRGYVDEWYSVCNFIDAKNLSQQALVKMYTPTIKFQVSNAKIANLPDGSSVVALGFELTDWDYENPYPKQYYLQRVDADGSMQKAVFIDTYYNKMNLLSEVSIILLGGNEVCLIVEDYWLEGLLDKKRVNIKCLALN